MANSSNHDINEVPGMIERYGPAAAAKKIKAMLEEKNNTPLNIGITGESGTGKSSFVNAFRGIDNRDDLAAPNGVVKTTMEPKSYPHPKWPNVKVWDLPGIGTTHFPAAQYLQHVQFKRYDFFIIISADRFKENDVKLALEIQRMEKKFYFVRSKIDDNMRAEKRSQKDFQPEKSLSAIRKNCIEGLAKEGIRSPQVFLVSSFEHHLYDFNLLEETLQRELPAHKGDVLLLAMTNSNVEIIKKKKAVLQSEINHVAWLSALAGAVPVVSLLADLNLLVSTANKYKVTFGLDSKSLQNLAQSAGVPLDDLRSVLNSRLALGELSPGLIIEMLEWSLPQKVGANLLRFIPIVGNIAAGALSFKSTVKALNDFLNMLAKDAESVFKRALNR
ncbi:interferon-inducible GTPase 5-like [Gymnodraco acuticeps]|uniref:Interferon-inducible GTPase 5-like n=1 Tax=Gymnodraco acuticeps TaxID=8218 RepID=A0A6P8V3X7_GYMAC|nr:interferon-inducible GTPase 5-like [Gymnodraco acuticeps]XP_034082139.1 interferon-inducible GTPase 5-like [Gymnodraco acuticeps]